MVENLPSFQKATFHNHTLALGLFYISDIAVNKLRLPEYQWQKEV